jgi:hypothetical protein
MPYELLPGGCGCIEPLPEGIVKARHRYDWRNMTDEELKTRLEQEEGRAKRALQKQDRAIARSNVEAIIKEQTRRFEAKFGLD